LEPTKTETVIHAFEKTVNKYIATEKKPLDYGVGCLLYRAEIHTIEAIGGHVQTNITDLSNYLGVTKSAVSQMIDKLVKKGMVNKQVLSKSDTEVALSLTKNGEQVCAGHAAYHKEFYHAIDQILTAVPEEDIKAFCEIMDKLDSIMCGGEKAL
jgi:DNA-binding MarR family transcriptional regulator